MRNIRNSQSSKPGDRTTTNRVYNRKRTMNVAVQVKGRLITITWYAIESGCSKLAVTPGGGVVAGT